MKEREKFIHALFEEKTKPFHYSTFTITKDYLYTPIKHKPYTLIQIFNYHKAILLLDQKKHISKITPNTHFCFAENNPTTKEILLINQVLKEFKRRFYPYGFNAKLIKRNKELYLETCTLIDIPIYKIIPFYRIAGLYCHIAELPIVYNEYAIKSKAKPF